MGSRSSPRSLCDEEDDEATDEFSVSVSKVGAVFRGRRTRESVAGAEVVEANGWVGFNQSKSEG